jgi:hypothetical protein
MLILLAWLVGFAWAGDCQSPREVSEESLQVAWISRTGKQVAGRSYLEVVRTGDLRAWLERNGREPLRLLRGLGMVKGKRGKRKAAQRWKITLFDVRRDILCRAIMDATPGEGRGGVSVCEESQHKPKWGHRPGFTGCGYIQDTQANVRGLDVYRVRWADAASWGFCVLPLSRFLKES